MWIKCEPDSDRAGHGVETAILEFDYYDEKGEMINLRKFLKIGEKEHRDAIKEKNKYMEEHPEAATRGNDQEREKKVEANVQKKVKDLLGDGEDEVLGSGAVKASEDLPEGEIAGELAEAGGDPAKAISIRGISMGICGRVAEMERMVKD